MTALVPEIATLPPDLILDGELVALDDDGRPHFPSVCARVLNAKTEIAVWLFFFDVLAVAGVSTIESRMRSGARSSTSSS